MAIAIQKREGYIKRVRWSLPSFRYSHWDVFRSKKCHQDLLWSFCPPSFEILSVLPLPACKVLQVGQVQFQHRVRPHDFGGTAGSLVSKLWQIIQCDCMPFKVSVLQQGNNKKWAEQDELCQCRNGFLSKLSCIFKLSLHLHGENISVGNYKLSI